MRARPPGSEVRIAYDSVERVRTGEALVTTTGRTYVIVGARRQVEGVHAGRWHLRCVVADGPPPPDARVHRLIWHRRYRRA